MPDKKYQQMVFSEFKENMDLPFMSKPQAYFRGESQIPGANMNFGWQCFVKPILLEKEPHTHDAHEYLIFLGNDTADLFSSFDAQIDLYLGEEKEHYLIDKPTVVYIPPNMVHCPLDFRVINRPVFFTALLQSPVFTKTMNGKEFVFRGPGIDGPIKPEAFD